VTSRRLRCVIWSWRDEGYHADTRQTQSLTALKEVLELSGSSLEKVVKFNIYLKDMDDMLAMNDTFVSVSTVRRRCPYVGANSCSSFQRAPSPPEPASRPASSPAVKTLVLRSRPSLRSKDFSYVQNIRHASCPQYGIIRQGVTIVAAMMSSESVSWALCDQEHPNVVRCCCLVPR
jgi:enamine deaminase RidA (YjgF/YER057c/UK114 family)